MGGGKVGVGLGEQVGTQEGVLGPGRGLWGQRQRGFLGELREQDGKAISHQGRCQVPSGGDIPRLPVSPAPWSDRVPLGLLCCRLLELPFRAQ